MSNVDERLQRRFQQGARPVEPPAFETLDRRRQRRQRRRALASGMLAVAVVAVSVGAFAIARSTFGDDRRSPAPIDVAPADPTLAAYGHIVVADGDALVMVDPSTGKTVPLVGLPEGIWGAAYSPDGERLALTVFPPSGPRELWVTDAAGRAALIASAPNISGGSWSPDGAYIAYAADDDSGSAIHVIRSDGTEDRVVGPVLQGRDYFSVDWSPDGTRLLFDAGTDVGYSISTMSLDGTDLRVLSSGRSDYDPRWSPDGSAIVFTHQDGPMDSDIFVMDADGTDVRRLTDGDDGDTNLGAVWAPDGSRIAYQAGVTGGPGPLWVMDPDGSHAELLLDAEILGIDWQPATADRLEPEQEAAGADIGLDFRLCHMQRLGGIDFFGDGSRGVAWTGSPLKESGRCSKAYDAPHVVAVDLDGDGSADSYTDLSICTGCEPHAATDLGGDGTKELIVLLQNSSTPQYGLFDVVPEGLPRGAGVYPLFVDPPGARRAGLPPGEPITLWAGGDEGFAAAIRCMGYPDAPEIEVTWSSFSIPDAENDPNATEEFHLTRLRLDEPGPEAASLVIVDTTSIDRPHADTLPFETPSRTCGVDWTL